MTETASRSGTGRWKGWTAAACALALVACAAGGRRYESAAAGETAAATTAPPAGAQATAGATAPREVQRIDPRDVKAWMDRGEAIVFVDARSPGSYAGSEVRIPGSIRGPAGDAAAIASVPLDRTIVAWCT